MQRYVSEERYWPLAGLSNWIRARSDDESRAIADAARRYDDDYYVTRIVDIREPSEADVLRYRELEFEVVLENDRDLPAQFTGRK